MDNQFSYEFTFEQKKTLGPEVQSTITRAFKNYDINKDGKMDKKEMKTVLIEMGLRKITDDEVTKIVATYDLNQDGFIMWPEFVEMMVVQNSHGDDRFGKVMEGTSNIQTTNIHGGTHTYAIEERTTFAKMINNILKDDEICADRIPMKVDDDSLFHIFDNGVLLCKLLNYIDENAVDFRAVNNKGQLNVYQIQENLKLAIAACKGLGVKMIGIAPSDFIDKVPHLILGCLWQVNRMYITKKISLKDTPEIMRLAQGDEQMTDLLKLTPDAILIRWMNYHLEKSGNSQRVTNLGKDLKDSTALFHVLNHLDKEKCPLDGINDTDLVSRADKMVSNALALGVPDVVQGSDIVKANIKVNTLFVSYIFNTKHGLEDLTKDEYEAAQMLDDDIEGSREERAFRLWINSLGIEDVYVNNLYEDVKDGLLMNKVIDKIDNSVVEWKKIDKAPKNDFGKNINNNTAIEAAKKLKLKLIGIGGTDLTKGDKKLTLAMIWQVARLHYLKLIGEKTEDDLVKWANESTTGKVEPVKNLRDKALCDGKFIIQMCAAIEPRAVNWDIVLTSGSDDDNMNNAKYAISIARKLGAVLFCVWEDIVNVNSKQMLILFATLFEINEAAKKEKA